MGNESLINGTLHPRLTVPKGKVGLRLLNGANMRGYSLSLGNNQSFDLIATKGGLLKDSHAMKDIHLSPSERAEIILDFSKAEAGEVINLAMSDGTILLPIHISEEEIDVKDVTLKRDPLYTITEEAMNKEVSKEVLLSGMGSHVRIKGKKFDANRIDMTQELGETKIWEVYNEPSMIGEVHPFHIHGIQFKVVSLNGERPPKELQGYKDTIHLDPGDRAKLAVKFITPGIYMYHCHILEHEDNGMMGQVLVEWCLIPYN